MGKWVHGRTVGCPGSPNCSVAVVETSACPHLCGGAGEWGWLQAQLSTPQVLTSNVVLVTEVT